MSIDHTRPSATTSRRTTPPARPAGAPRRDGIRWRRARPGRAACSLAVGIALLGAAGCSSDDTADDAADGVVGVGTIATTPITVTPGSVQPRPALDTTAAAPDTVVVPVDGAALLAAATAALDAGYHFTTTVTIGGAEALVADGDHTGDGSRLTLTSDGATVSYLITADGSWTSTGDGTWSELDTEPATADPMTALRTPTTVAVVGDDGTTTTLSVIVPAAALGVTGDAPATVQAVIVGGALTAVDYATTANGAAATVHATVSALVDTTPITAPV